VPVGFAKNRLKIKESSLYRPVKKKNGALPTTIGAKLEPDPKQLVLFHF
jgi:hypothetical protein